MHTAGMQSDHTYFMQLALQQARLAAACGEVPVGAVLVDDKGEVLAAGHNHTVGMNDPTAHAEIIALRKGALETGNYRLLSVTLYATIEPCVMCMGALIHARVARDRLWRARPQMGCGRFLVRFSQRHQIQSPPASHQGGLRAGMPGNNSIFFSS